MCWILPFGIILEDGTCNYDAEGDCADGLKEYESTYIDPLFEVLSQYHEKVRLLENGNVIFGIKYCRN